MDEKYPYSVLFVEDEESIRKNYVIYLQLFFEHVYEAGDGVQGYEIYKAKSPDILIIDINMPNMNGLELLAKIRQEDQHVKAIMLTAHTDNSFLLQAVELKLNKYLIKPVDREKLNTALQDTIKELQSYTVQKKDIVILEQNYSWDVTNEVLYHFKDEIIITAKERMFLALLMSNLQKTFTYEEISIEVWGYDETGSLNSIKTLVKNLRKKIPKEIISNIFSVGYKINFNSISKN